MAKVRLQGPSDVYVLSDGTEVHKGAVDATEVDQEVADQLALVTSDRFSFEEYDPYEVDATDAAAKKARQLGIELSQVEGTGKDGRITVEDVENAQPAEQIEGPPIGGDLSNEARTAGDQPTALIADEDDPYVDGERNPGAHPLTAGAGSESPTGDNSRDIDESDPDREPVQK
jgi:pyruvate/2-oxoglutarate dehydrogenase complex dihydrolipoamide acyltransferase (E2) component